jgi:lysozyme
MNLLRLEQQVMQDEGFRDTAYLDTVNVWTIGFGTTRMYGRAVHEGDTITAAEARIHLRADLYGAIITAKKVFPLLDKMNDVRQEVLVNMAYNLGETRLRKFKKMIIAHDNLNFTDMAREMVDSKWYRQVGGRGQRLVHAMKMGRWAHESIT